MYFPVRVEWVGVTAARNCGGCTRQWAAQRACFSYNSKKVRIAVLCRDPIRRRHECWKYVHLLSPLVSLLLSREVVAEVCSYSWCVQSLLLLHAYVRAYIHTLARTHAGRYMLRCLGEREYPTLKLFNLYCSLLRSTAPVEKKYLLKSTSSRS